MPIHPNYKMPSQYNPDMLTEPQMGGFLDNGQAPVPDATPAQDVPTQSGQPPPQVQASNDQIMQYLMNRKRMAEITSPQAMQDQTPFHKPLSLGADIGVKTPPMLQSYSQPDYGVGAGHLPTQDPDFARFNLGADIYQGEALPDAPTPNTPQSPEPVKPSAVEAMNAEAAAKPAYQRQEYGLPDSGRTTENGRNNLLLAALAEAAGRVGNVGGVAQKTTAYDFADKLEKANSGEANVTRQINVYKLNEMKRANDLTEQKKDPNSEVSRSYRELFNQYYGKYGKIRDHVSAEVMDKYLPFISKMWDSEQMAMNANQRAVLMGEVQAAAQSAAQQGQNDRQARALENQNLMQGRQLTAQEQAQKNQLEAAERARQEKIAADKALADQAAANRKDDQKNNQAFLAEQRRQAEADRRAAAALKQADEAKERNAKLELENKELVVPGYELTGEVRPSSQEAQKLRTALATKVKFINKLNAYRQLVAKNGTYENSVASPDGAAMASLATNMQLDLKTIAELGALSGPDMGLLIDLLPNPNNWKSAFKTTGALNAQLKQLEAEANNSINSQLMSKGYRKAGTAAPSGAPASQGTGRPVWRPK